ncbi:hypothetical protein Syun_001664 [Stephania yunnanensis]|uniref:Uncharacterized protein n=1 Tax=Stephania yunnanensis TaxID=152371 RepID=A0AAP0Q7Z8_9MAGN
MHKLKKNPIQPDFVLDEEWKRYLECYESDDFLSRSRYASLNRNIEVEGPLTRVSKHGGGLVSFVTTNERLTFTFERTLIVTDFYLHLYTVKGDEITFIDTRSKWFYAQFVSIHHELTQATPDQSVDDLAVYHNVVGDCPKGRV